MSKASVMVEFHKKRDEISTQAKDKAERILTAIDIDKLLDSPKTYLSTLGTVFMGVQKDNLEKAFELGKKYGKDTLP